MNSKKPNVIIIMTDQQRADLRRSMGFELDVMPFLDQLGSEGADFTNAYTPMPACVPARVSLFTGRYPSATRVRTNHNIKDVFYHQDILDVFKEQGYLTALCGKNHSHRDSSDFDYAYELMHNGAIRSNSDVSEEERAFDNYLAELHHEIAKTPAPFPVECQGPYRAVDRAIHWIDGVKEEEKPFFMWLSFAEPHNPYQAPEPYFSMFEDQLPPTLSDAQAVADKSYKYRWLHQMWGQVYDDFDQTIDRMRANYYGMLRLIDDQVRRFAEYLNSSGLQDNTLLVYLSDHGDFVGEYGLIRKGPELPEVLCRIPMIFNGPGVKAKGQIKNAHVSIVDILPTLCDAIGAQIPAGIQGTSMWPILTDGYIDSAFDSAYMEHGFGGAYYNEADTLDPKEEGAINDFSGFDCLNSWTQAGTMRAVRMGQYKLVYDMMGTGQLYDLEKDPVELTNLFYDPCFSDVREKLLLELLKRVIAAADSLPLPRKRYVQKPF